MHRSLATAIDALNALVGRVVAWLCLLMVAIGAFNAVARYLGRFIGVNLSSNAYIELQWYLFSLLFLLGAAYTLQRDAHVRVDVIYGRLSERTRAWIDLAGAIVFLIPFCVFVIVVSSPAVHNSWAVLEGSPDPGGLPRYPLKTVIPVAFVLLILQGISLIIGKVDGLRRDARGRSGHGGAGSGSAAGGPGGPHDEAGAEPGGDRTEGHR
jgi:TRAP-type mannitol/chloroaromatic compound transport system permease small subunit